MKVLIDCLIFHCGVHVCPNEWDCASGDAATFVGDFDCDVFLSLHDDDFDRGKVVFVIVAVTFDNCSERVFEEFETNMRQVAGYVRKGELHWADELNGRTSKHCVVFFAYETSIFDRFVDDIMNVLWRKGQSRCKGRTIEKLYRLCADNSDIILVCLLIIKGDVCGKNEKDAREREGGRWRRRTLTDQETNADAGQVEAIEPGLNVKTDITGVLTSFPLENALCDCSNGWIMPLFDSFQSLCETVVVVLYFGGPIDRGCLCVIPGAIIGLKRLQKGEDERPFLHWYS